MSQADVQAQSPTAELRSAQDTPRPVIRHLTKMAKGIMNTFSQKPFNVLLSSFFPRPVHLLSNTVIGHALKAKKETLSVTVLKLLPL